MQTTTDLIAAATAEAEKTPGYQYDYKVLASSVKDGLLDGDRIGLGGKLIAEIHTDRVHMISDGAKAAELAVSDLTDEQHDRMIVLKAAQAASRAARR